MNKMTFFIALATEFLAFIWMLDIYFGTPECIILALILFVIFSLLVLVLYLIRKKTSRPPKSSKIQFYQNGILNLFGILTILLFTLCIYIKSQI